MPFNLGSPSAPLSTPAPSGANRLGSLDNLVVILNVLLAGSLLEYDDKEGLRILVNS